MQRSSVIEKGPTKEIAEKLPCDMCTSNGGDGHTRLCGRSTEPMVFCTTSYDVDNTCWVPIRIARACKGPKDLQARLIVNFMREEDPTAPPDS